MSIISGLRPLPPSVAGAEVGRRRWHSQALLISAIVIIFALDNAHCLAGAGCP